jgi:hypothetical protein
MSQFRSFFHKALHALHLQHCGFKPYSLRRGGATHDFMYHQHIQRTLMRGRWADMRTGRIYITDGSAALAAIQLPANAKQRIAQYRQHFLNHFNL